MRIFLPTKRAGFPEIDWKNNLLSEALLSSLEPKFQEVAMENHVEGTVGARVGVQGGAEGASETKKKWDAPELRKFQIAEVTAANPNLGNPDGALGAS